VSSELAIGMMYKLAINLIVKSLDSSEAQVYFHH